MYLLEALAPLDTSVHVGGRGPLAAIFSGNVRGMTCNVRSASIVLS